MTRPANPTWSPLVWAPDVAYPASASPWSSTPTKVASPGAASVGITPRTAFAAQMYNYVTNKLGNDDAAAKTLLDQLVDYVGQIPVLNFTTAVGSIGTLNRAKYDPATRRWFVLGSSNNVRASRDQGWTWSAHTMGGAGTETWHNIAFDAAGNAVAVGINASNHPISNSYTASTDSWAGPNVLVASPFDPGEFIQVAYDPVSGLFCALSRLFAGPYAAVHTSSNRTTWTSRTPPTNFDVSNAEYRMATDGLGRIVATAGDSAGTVCVASSDDGGITWTARANVTTTIATGQVPGHIFYNAATATWAMSMHETSGTPSSEVWTSSDGISWTKVCTLAASAVFGLAPFGAMWVGVAVTGGLYQVVYSLDACATWQLAGFSLVGTPTGVFASPIGLLIGTTNSVYPGMRAGRPSTSLT
jgi:hypothetical protein